VSPKTERFEMRLDEEVIAAVDRWRAQRGSSRAEAVRQLIDVGLEAADKQPVRFSPGETLTVYMLCEIIKGLKVQTHEINTTLIQEALVGGHLWGFRWGMSGLFHHHVDSERVVSDVVNLLDMWSFIEQAYERFDDPTKERIKQATGYGPPVSFFGFDANDARESEYIGVARYMIEVLGRFERFAKRDLNSHMPTVAMYDRMYQVFEPIRKTLIGHGLDETQMIKIFAARVHPSNRK
jgi:uncharacterized protein